MNNNYMTFQLWNEPIVLSRDFVKSTTLSTLTPNSEISEYMKNITHQLINKDNIFSNIVVSTFTTRDTDVPYKLSDDELVNCISSNLSGYRTCITQLLIWISNCYEYKFGNKEHKKLRSILYKSEEYGGWMTIFDSLHRLLIPSLLCILINYLEIDDRVLFVTYNNVFQLLEKTIVNYNDSATGVCEIIEYYTRIKKNTADGCILLKMEFISNNKINVTFPDEDDNNKPLIDITNVDYDNQTSSYVIMHKQPSLLYKLYHSHVYNTYNTNYVNIIRNICI